MNISKLVESRRKSIAKLEAEIKEIASRPTFATHFVLRGLVAARTNRKERLEAEVEQLVAVLAEDDARQLKLPGVGKK